MEKLGEALAFSLRYPAEMNRLCWAPPGNKLEVVGLDDALRVAEMARVVGDAACEQAANFLATCAEQIVAHFESFKSVLIRKEAQRRTLKKNWDYYAALERDPWKDGCWFFYGVWINSRQGAVVPYLWRNGGREPQDAMKKILRTQFEIPDGQLLDCDSGTIPIASFQVLSEATKGFDVDMEPLVANVVGKFKAISKEVLESLLQAAGKQGTGQAPPEIG